MTSAAKITANRRNGARSRGPRTAAGKGRSSRNRFLYSIDARAFVTPGEDAAAFRALAKLVLEAWQPQTRFERLLVHRLCGQLWQRERLMKVERALLGDRAAAQKLPEPLREGLAEGQVLDRLAKLHAHQITLDGAVQQSIALLTEITGRKPTGAADERDADGQERDRASPATPTHAVPRQPRPASPKVREDAFDEAPVRHSMQPPRTNFGKK